MRVDYDLIIVGSGAGGGTLAYALKDSGMRILIVERGDFLPQEPENWNTRAVFAEGRYKTSEKWYNANNGKPFSPSTYYFVGGNTKVYGACLPRFRQADFMALEHEGGTSPAWALTYADYEPYYARAEQLYLVHGVAGQDPTEPPRSSPFPFPAVANEPYIEHLAEQLRAQGLHPFALPLGIDLRENGRCIRCKTCGGFPCRVDAKGEADLCCVRPALQSSTIELLVQTKARRLLTDSTGKRITGLEVERDSEIFTLHADRYIVSCGAVNSAVLLLHSANDAHPHGLANSSGLVGRNYMIHNGTTLMAIHPTWINNSVFQKTMAINDYYLNGESGFRYPMGNIQLLGKLQEGMLLNNQPLIPHSILRQVTHRSVDWWVMSEDLPDVNNRVTLGPDGHICIRWQPNNMVAHDRLVAAARRMMQVAGYPVVLTRHAGISSNPHQCGTLRFGADPETSVLDQYCKAHDLDNLYVVDSSFFPSSAALNPTLTIAAQALRVGDHLMGKLQ